MRRIRSSRYRSVAEVEAGFADCLQRAERGEPTVVTRHGKPVAAVVPMGLLERLERLRSARRRAGLVSVAGGWEGSEEVAEKALEHGRSAGRRVSAPE